MSNIYVPSPELTTRQIELAQKLYELRSEKSDKLDRIAEIDSQTPALETEWKQIQEEITLGLFGMVVRLEPAPPPPPPPPPPAPETEAVADAPVEAVDGETAPEAVDAPAATEDAPAAPEAAPVA